MLTCVAESLLIPHHAGTTASGFIVASRVLHTHTMFCFLPRGRDIGSPGENCFHQPIPAQLAHLHWSSGHDFRLSRVKSRQARETRVRFPDGEHTFLYFCCTRLRIDEELLKMFCHGAPYESDDKELRYGFADLNAGQISTFLCGRLRIRITKNYGNFDFASRHIGSGLSR
jgi:hypothetical protein